MNLITKVLCSIISPLREWLGNSGRVSACRPMSEHQLPGAEAAVDPPHVQLASSASTLHLFPLQARGTVAQNPINAILPGQARHESCQRDRLPYNPHICNSSSAAVLDPSHLHAGSQAIISTLSPDCKESRKLDEQDEIQPCRHAAETGYFGVCQVRATVDWVCCPVDLELGEMMAC